MAGAGQDRHLTHGKPVQTDLQDWEPSDLSRQPAALVAASLAARSDHPVSLAVANAAREAGHQLLDVADFAALPGRGVAGVIDGVTFQLGNRRLMREAGVASDAPARMDELERQGKSVIGLTDGSRVLALAAVADTVKPTSAAAIAELHALGVRTLMLTGDNTPTARAIAAQVGIDEARGDQLPEDKLAAIESKLSPAGKVGMVGDGINDAPALARADIGFAMGAAGTGTAIETADVALMDDDLRKIGVFLRLSRATHSVLVQNIALALGIKAVFLALAMTGNATLWMAVFADVGASLLVVANGCACCAPRRPRARLGPGRPRRPGPARRVRPSPANPPLRRRAEPHWQELPDDAEVAAGMRGQLGAGVLRRLAAPPYGQGQRQRPLVRQVRSQRRVAVQVGARPAPVPGPPFRQSGP